MCPICWTTALASFSVLVIVSAIAAVGTDRWSQIAIVGLAALVGLHQASMIQASWWSFILVMALVAARAAWLVIRTPEELIAVRLWTRSLEIAKRRCPRQDVLESELKR